MMTQSDLPLNEFIKLPTTVAFYSWYTPAFQDYIEERPYIKLGRVLENEIAVLYTSQVYMESIFKELGSDFLNVYPEIYGLTGVESLDAAGILRVQQQPYLNLTGTGVIVGIVDTGIDYTQPVFKYEDGTSKIEYIWDQTVGTGSSDLVEFGSVFTKEQIDEALRNENPYDIVPHLDQVGHGTYLSSLIAGREYEGFIGAAPDAQIIAVKLKPASNYYRNIFLVPPEQENAYESIDIMLGIDFILKQSLLAKKPAVICLGLGTNFGGHNGQNRLENYISFISNIPGVAVCTGVGNESNARHHTEGRIERQGETASIEVRVGEKAQSISVYIWYEGWDKISFSLKSPTGELINKIPFFRVHILKKD